MPSHGSLTKAGKVRSQTPKVPAKERHGLSPLHRNRKNFLKRMVYAPPEDERRGRRH
ncbi:MAG: 30S ribosomal protein S30e [Candidatus Methanomethylicia archaeon]|uniref:30S ribosomal protein S30e n=1 Tax=Candidatus Methanomethylicus mesodigestus TaxID=1867258 RepID=A0A7C3F0Y3_9CREN|nr:30S ribosomal protein S30e [Candidatus Methanomethylicia archaeon]